MRNLCLGLDPKVAMDVINFFKKIYIYIDDYRKNCEDYSKCIVFIAKYRLQLNINPRCVFFAKFMADRRKDQVFSLLYRREKRCRGC